MSDAGYTNLHYQGSEVEKGSESFGTFFLYRHDDNPYVIDRAFLRGDRLPDLRAFTKIRTPGST